MSSDLPAYEKLGAFYLGRPWDPQTGGTLPAPLLYDSQDLLTHAVCVGMTGSGKTGLCVGLLEEAAIDGIPALIIDPKGDLGNLMLTFPDLAPEDFRPWVDEGEARRKGLSVEEYAAQQAGLWRKGLADWDQDGERIRRLRGAAEVAIYTPGSEAGLPVSILGSLAAPPPAVLADAELLGDRVQTLAGGLLGLLGMKVDPLQSREHILLSQVLADRWRAVRDLDLAGLIQLIQEPPFQRVGVLDLETFYPAKERFGLAIALNNLMAAPGMASWLAGDPLNVDRLLYTESGKPRLAVMSIAHLSESERMFFVSLVLNETLGWMRSKPGTTSLRAVLYMDEVFGFLPPVAEPPSKKPLLTMLKQARAFGLGVVLATQNPADLDYKALSNAGTWFLGRLQTERDKLRVLEGLEGAAASLSGGGFDRARMEQTLAGLDKRVFLLHNVHEPEPVLFHTRWAMSYLRGPLTRLQIQQLMAPGRAAAAPAGAPVMPAAAAAAAASRAPAAAAPAPSVSPRPVLPPGVPQLFLTERRRPAGERVYQPGLLGLATVHFTDAKTGIDHRQGVALRLPLEAGEVDWYRAEELDPQRFDPERDLEAEPAGEAAWRDLPAAAAQEKSYKDWERDLADALYRERRLELYKSPDLGELSQPGESERDFRIRLGEKAREVRDAEKAKLEKKYAAKLKSAENRVARAEEKVEREAGQAQQQKWQTGLSFLSAVAGALTGSKIASRSNVGRATTAFRGVGRSVKEGQDVARAEAAVEEAKQELADLQAEVAAEIDALAERFDPEAVALETSTLRPRKSDVEVRQVALAWAPFERRPDGGLARGWE